jgi:hypothetical protein
MIGMVSRLTGQSGTNRHGGLARSGERYLFTKTTTRTIKYMLN